MDFTVSLARMPPTLPLSSFAACAGQQECSPPDAPRAHVHLRKPWLTRA
jgi:hypothetical protein